MTACLVEIVVYPLFEAMCSIYIQMNQANRRLFKPPPVWIVFVWFIEQTKILFSMMGIKDAERKMVHTELAAHL